VNLSLIAIMPGRLKMGVADCIAAYLSLSDRVFRKTRHQVTVRAASTQRLVQAMKVVRQQGLHEDALLNNTAEAQCKV
jgi:hypothetical protein